MKETWNLFAYGSLKQGFAAHRRLCRLAGTPQPALVWGRLWRLPEGYPLLEVPANNSPEEPSEEYLATGRISTGVDWRWIHGEFLPLTMDSEQIAALDEWEGIGPGQQNMYYQRMERHVYLLPTGQTKTAWVYAWKGQTTPPLEFYPMSAWPP